MTQEPKEREALGEPKERDGPKEREAPGEPKERDGPKEPEGSELPARWDVHGAPDATLGGYVREHGRPPAFDGADGEPYTVSLETEKTPDLRAPYEGYLVFPRWAATGLGVMGHVETPTLVRGRTREETLDALGRLPLLQVKALLDEAIRRGADEGPERDERSD